MSCLVDTSSGRAKAAARRCLVLSVAGIATSLAIAVPDVPGGDAVEVEHLLRHTSGIYNYTSDPSYLADSLSHRRYTPRELLDIAFGYAPSFAPGEPGKWEYSNTNYVLLGTNGATFLHPSTSWRWS